MCLNKIFKHLPIQTVDQEGEVETYCGVIGCGKDWGYYNRTFYWLRVKIRLHQFFWFIYK